MKYGKVLYGFVKADTKREEAQVLADFEHTELRSALKNWAEATIKEANAVVKADYDNPSWPYLQAHINGNVETARKLLDLLS